MSASKEDVPAAQAPKRRATLRRWITISHQALSAGVNPGKGHQPPITRQAVDSIGGELILHDIDNPDERVAEYVEKLREIKQFLDEQEEKQRQQEIQTLQLQAERLRVDKEAALIEQAKAKTAAATRPTGNPMRLELKIPPFDGSPSKYRRFEELFESLIEESPSYTDAAKFLYFCELIGKLTDQYAPNLSPTLANLQVLKGRLRERFEDAGRVREHVRATFERLPTVRQSNQTNLLHQLIVAWEEGVLALQKTGTSDEQINNTYVRLMTHHLSSSVLDKCNYEDSWTALELLDALKRFHKRQLKLNEASSDSSSAPQREPKPRSHIHIAQPDPSRPRPVHHRASPLPNAGPERSPTLSECAICTGSHRTIYCNSFTVEKRRELVAKKKLCTRCLGNDHDQLDCRSSYVCRCGRPHSRVLCSQLAKNNSNSRPNSTNINLNAESDEDDTTSRTSPQQTIPKTFADTDSEEEEEIFTATTTTTANNNRSTQPTSSLKYARPDRLVSYYKTVVVNINGHKVRVLLDGGGGRSAITEACANRLNLPLYAEQDLGISGLGGKGKLASTRLISAELCSLVSAHKLSVVLSVLPSLNGFKPAAIPGEFWEELRANGYVLTDTPDHHHEPIEIILGLEYIGYIWLSAEKLATEDICIRQSIFGWTAFGVTLTTKASTAPIRLMCSTFESKPKECTTAAELSPLEKQFLEEFVRSKVTQQNGQYFVQLPWLEPTNLGSNLKQATDRFHRLVKSLISKGRAEQYAAAMAETIANFAEPAPNPPTSSKVYHLPHHCVVRLDKETTQLRVVFDGSAAETGYQSLNDCLFKGVNNWSSLDLLLSFRLGASAVVADIEKAFLQIKVAEQDRDALRFWWFDEQGRPTVYRFTSVPFGTSTSPFLLYAVMHKLLSEIINNEQQYPELSTVASLIKDRFYVDDLMLSFQQSTPEQIDAIQAATVAIFRRGSMNVRKWRTNVKELDEKWSPNAAAILKVLGHKWSVILDSISLFADLPPQIELSKLTKRLFSSLLARIYDPMGLITPYIVHLRLLLRKIWTQGLDWDEPVPNEIRAEVLSAVKDAHLVNNVIQPRNVIGDGSSPAKLVVFCDASKNALGAVAYAVVNNKPLLLFSKSRLVRLSAAKKDKEETIAELELDALVMSSEIVNYLSNLVSIRLGQDSTTKASPFAEVAIVYSDSLLNLQRLIKHPNDQRPSIFLRVNRMKSLVPAAVYRHVDTKQNPADLISRGCPMSDLLNHPLWFNPPMPSEHSRFSSEITTSIAAMSPTIPPCTCSRFRDYVDAVRQWRIVARGFHRALSKDRQALPPSLFGKILLIKYLQRQHFQSEIEALSKQQQIDSKSVLRGFKCFLDANGILRLRTRLLSGDNLSDDQVKPIILPQKCHLTELIIQFEHERLGHPGIDRTRFAIRDQFFVFGLRRSVNKLISRCNLCKRLRGKTLTADLGSVPKFRYEINSTPFTNVGIDIFGPLKVAMNTAGKRYGVIFSCATTRAVHLELIHNQTAAEVFRAMTNFISRRGIPHLIYTDNGTNLMAVKKQFVRLLQQITDKHPGQDFRVKWIQLTASSPWRGGFYERLIKTIKDTLTALTFRKVVDNDTLASALYAVEARLNSRPLFLHEGRVITPAHFFSNRPLMQMPPIGTSMFREMDKPALVQQYKVFQSHINSVWKAWQSQYLLQLKSFHENLFLPNQSSSLRVGDAVILKNPTSPEQWPFGVVTEVIKSEDGAVRTVQVRTHDRGNLTIKTRDVRTLIPFECTQELHAEKDAAQSVETPTPDPQIETMFLSDR
ncbi:hypothetical protein TYRP_016184 [Tyrophagus putrescentiae]|nr:hypothetical protein TYRP_016184 [Tyrophagus putrescentiae]